MPKKKNLSVEPIQTEFGGTYEFSQAPDSVRANVRDMEEIVRRRELRKAGNANIARKNDTEKFLVIVFDSREQREAVLQKLNLPHDERYLLGSALTIALNNNTNTQDALVLTRRNSKIAPVEKAGAGG